MVYEDLLEESMANNIYVIENANFTSQANGLINGDVIGINKNIRTYRKRACILAEEIGHYYTTVGNILSLSNEDSRKQELKARLWAYDRLIGLKGIVQAYEHGCRNLCETAEFLDVTEDFFNDALIAYQNKYGTCVKHEDYIITFIPTLCVKPI